MDESSAPGRKGNKERVTFMPCANADGSFKLPLMMIGKSKRPRALKNVHELPVYYASSKNAWMTRQLFKDWFLKDADELRTADGAISTIFLPPNTTALLQPMDQNVIQMVKSNYKQKLYDAMFWVAEAWDEVPADSIAKSWKILYIASEFDDEDDIPLAVVRERLLSIQQKLMDQDNTVHEEDVEFLLREVKAIEERSNDGTEKNTVIAREGAVVFRFLETYRMPKRFRNSTVHQQNQPIPKEVPLLNLP
ncbi:jerky protein homolog-like [Ochlerotatus camptorhynchus]|uniref:jerky protein homolog-like n=1 Tax=Ochlerotatus camptorhynchus TaxID=644619 RepID=UPI0031E3C9B5